MSPQFRKVLLLFGDIFLLYLALLTAIYFGFWKNFSWEIFFQHLFPFTILYFFWVVIFYIFGLYDLNLIKTNLNFLPRISGALFVAILVGVIFFYLFPIFGISPKTNLVLDIFFAGILIFAWRKLFYQLFSSHLLTKVAIIGESSQTEELAKEISERPYLGYKLVGIFSRSHLSQISKENIDLLVIAEDPKANPQLLENLYNLLSNRINFLFLAQAYEIICEKIPVTSIGKTWFLENLREGQRDFYDKLKMIEDIILASIILLLTLPLWLFIVIAIKLEDGGPILYFQKRIGKDRKPFWLIKFRSMQKEAEKETGAIWAKEKDSRITKVGKILRRFHLDELPQMINILKGELSLVGPRPERPEFVEKLEKEIPYYHLRHLIKPGLTGWAQIKFRYARSVLDSYEKFQYDLYYIKNRSLSLDLKIILKTINILFRDTTL